jgi:hypothetical protein
VTNWPAVLLDGSVGGVVGTFGAFWSAVWVVKRQSRSDRELSRLERRLATAVTIHPILQDIRLEMFISPAVASAGADKDLVRVQETFARVLDKMMLVYVAGRPVSPFITERMDIVMKLLAEARAGVLPTDNNATALAKYSEGLEKARSVVGQTLAHLSIFLERDGDLYPSERKKRLRLPWG